MKTLFSGKLVLVIAIVTQVSSCGNPSSHQIRYASDSLSGATDLSPRRLYLSEASEKLPESMPFVSKHKAAKQGEYFCFRTPGLVKGLNGDILAFAGGEKVVVVMTLMVIWS